MASEMPAMASARYASQAYDPQTMFGGQVSAANPNAAAFRHPVFDKRDELLAKMVAGITPENRHDSIEEQKPMARRIVQVFIADPDPKLALEDALVYKGEQHLTDMDDQELFFQVDIRALLAAHNEKRTKTVDKAVRERTQNLEPARIRDLKMVVVTVAAF